jgi:hypothetical protein
MTTEPETFKNRQEAHDWLLANGYQVSIGKFYQDIKRKGFPVINPDKTISKYQVAVYGKNLATDQQPDPSALSRSEYTQQKEKAEAEMAIMKAERMRREEDELWLHAEQAWSAIAGLVGSLRDVIRRHLHDEQVRIVQAAGGDPVRSPEVFEYVDQVIGRAFNEVAGAPLDIQWEEEA